MQVVVASPPLGDMDRLDTPVCGVPLLVRVIATAQRCGGTGVLVLCPPGLPDLHLHQRLQSSAINSVQTKTLQIAVPFDPNSPAHWSGIAQALEPRFLWLPCDYVAYQAALSQLLTRAAEQTNSNVRFSGGSGGVFERPAVLLKEHLIEGRRTAFEVVDLPDSPGASLGSPITVKLAEAALVCRSGKATDGIYSRFNRRLCRPAVRWLSHTQATPNAVSLAGLAAAALAGYCFAQGEWAMDAAGGALFFISGLFDEIDGMLARLKFQESPFGCWLETMVDYATYVLAFAGMMVGGYRRDGEVYLVLGAALLFGSILAFIVISMQRKLAAPAGAPNEYYQNFLKSLDGDARNPLSVAIRKLHFLTRKGVLIHYVLLFSVLGWLPLFLILAAFGANVTWVVTIYFNRRLYFQGASDRSEPSPALAEHQGVEK